MGRLCLVGWLPASQGAGDRAGQREAGPAPAAALGARRRGWLAVAQALAQLGAAAVDPGADGCLLYTSPSPRD